jgi:ATP-dependent exoDNAse (exonuclease V) beta subunit
MATLLHAYQERIEKGLYALQALKEQDSSKSDLCDAIRVNLESVLKGKGEWIEYTGQLRKNKQIDSETFEAVKALRDSVNNLRWSIVDPAAEQHYLHTLKAIYALFVKVYERFRSILTQDGYTDFETILQQANTLLEQDITILTRYFMVDEFQDTNGYQWGIITKAASKNDANIFIVGDEKQSIFSFQGADVSVFAKASQSLGLATPISMEVNRRSDRAIISLVNDVFASAMIEKGMTTFKRIEC